MAVPLESRIDATRGPFIEISAVPSNVRHHPMINLSRINKHLLTSNFGPQEKLEHLYRNRLTGSRLIGSVRPPSYFYEHLASGPTGERDEGVDLLIDAEDMPMDTASVGTLYATALPNELEVSLLDHEAARVLEPGGVLVLESANNGSVEKSGRYFDILKIKRLGETSINFAAVRNEVPFGTTPTAAG